VETEICWFGLYLVSAQIFARWWGVVKAWKTIDRIGSIDLVNPSPSANQLSHESILEALFSSGTSESGSALTTVCHRRDGRDVVHHIFLLDRS
jgi:hypothetical protein